MLKMPEVWDIQDRCKVQQPDINAPSLVRHSTMAMADRFDLAVAAMPPEAQERLARAVYTLQTIIMMQKYAAAQKPAVTLGAGPT